jgi:hypothetical protein
MRCAHRVDHDAEILGQATHGWRRPFLNHLYSTRTALEVNNETSIFLGSRKAFVEQGLRV